MPGLGFDPNGFYNQEYVENQETVAISPTVHAKRVILYDSSGNEVYGVASTIVDGTKTVTTAGTAVQITAASTPIKGIWVNADLLAGQPVVVGSSTVVGDAPGMRGIILTPGSPPVFLAITNLNLLWVDSTSNGGKLAYLYYT